ncbi:solute carrier family 2, facilitated glucose transporter member 10-like [Nilaparvata lugens]|uniref:solute carrier family 2, facilitated glucose transporter member 10-like n=1 Tax=Nilaparvata lugens TaxID=108931 RepID=UPI00193E7605|nr:solute carrier family 2, facilitated glucose transporter member 10-like [Nilaparvata lugens]
MAFLVFNSGQCLAAISASLFMMVCGSCFVWYQQASPKLLVPDPIVLMTQIKMTWTLSVLEFGVLLSPFLAGMITDCWGRKTALLFATPALVGSWIITMFRKNNINAFYSLRILLGYALNFIYTVSPIYLSEIATPNHRGKVCGLMHLMWNFGYLSECLVKPLLKAVDNMHLNLILTILVFFVYLAQPESPYYLIMVRKCNQQAFEALKRLRPTQTDEATVEELAQIGNGFESENSNQASWWSLVATPVDRKILMITQVLTTVRYASGTILISYLGEKLITNILNISNPIDNHYLLLFNGFIMLVTTTSVFTVDFIGRVPLLIISQIGITASHLVSSVIFWLHDHSNTDISDIFPATSLMIYLSFFSLGLGPLTHVIQTELFPSHNRGYGSVITMVNMTLTCLVSNRLFIVLNSLFGLYANFMFFTVVSLFGLVFTCLYLPETKCKTFTQIRACLSLPKLSCDENKC